MTVTPVAKRLIDAAEMARVDLECEGVVHVADIIARNPVRGRELRGEVER